MVAAMDGWALLTVLSLLAAFAGLSWFVRRQAGALPSVPGAITVQGRHTAGPNHTLWLLDVAGHRVLVGSGRGGVQLLTRLNEPSCEPALPPELIDRLPRIERWRNEAL